jgi:hypothetical protein
MPTLVESYDEFVARHGGNPCKVGNVWLMADAARIENHGQGPVCFEPPVHHIECLRLRREYATERLRLAEDAFKQCKATLLGHSDGSGFVPPFNWPKHLGHEPVGGYGSERGPIWLREIRAIVVKRRAALNELGEDPVAILERQRQEDKRASEAADMARVNKLRLEIESIEI